MKNLHFKSFIHKLNAIHYFPLEILSLAPKINVKKRTNQA